MYKDRLDEALESFYYVGLLVIHIYTWLMYANRMTNSGGRGMGY